MAVYVVQYRKVFLASIKNDLVLVSPLMNIALCSLHVSSDVIIPGRSRKPFKVFERFYPRSNQIND